MKVVILGGGISGRLAQFRLRKAGYPSTIFEARSKKQANNLTRMWGTNYLWKPLPGIDYREFKVVTTVDYKEGTYESISRYKRKIGKPDDIGEWGLQFEPETRGYDIVEMPKSRIVYDVAVVHVEPEEKFILVDEDSEEINSYSEVKYDVLISTIPLNTFTMMCAGSAGLATETMFKHSPIYIKTYSSPILHDVTNEIHVNYISDHAIPCYRTCDRDGLRHAEYLRKQRDTPIVISPGKIKTNGEAQTWVKELQEHGIQFFGRFASWAPNELVHETDEKIRRFVDGL